jgi:oligoribonuclease NrnB/cAMP/cGMP phosphodiesterase (DHH superfamily)
LLSLPGQAEEHSPDKYNLSSDSESLLRDGFTPRAWRREFCDPDILIPDETIRQQKTETLTALAEAHDTLVLTDDDADGQAAAALIESAFDNVGIMPIDHHTFDIGTAATALNTISSTLSHLFVLDIHYEKQDIADFKTAPIDTIHWYDHHSWDAESKTTVDNVTDDFKVDTNECATSLVAAEYITDSQHLALAREIRAADLHLDPSQDGLLYSKLAHYISGDEFRNHCLEYGLDLPSDVRDIVRTEESFDHAVATDAAADFTILYNGSFTLIATYGNGPSPTIASRIYNRVSDPTVVAVIKNHGGVGFYADSVGQFSDCDSLAEKFDGGGHSTAAGATIAEGILGRLAIYGTNGKIVHKKLATAAQEIDEIDGTIHA